MSQHTARVIWSRTTETFFLALAAKRGLMIEAAIVDELHHQAHQRCYIGNSLKSEVVIKT